MSFVAKRFSERRKGIQKAGYNRPNNRADKPTIAIQLENALAFHEKDRHESRRSVQTSRRLAQEALTDVRRSVGLLRSQNGAFSLAEMVHDLAASEVGSQPNVAVHVAGDETVYTLELRMVLYRASQEALTNIRRHAQATHAHLDLRFDAESATLSITDDGVGFDLVRYEAAARDRMVGFGIQGLRERLALVGGSLAIERAQNRGTLLTVVVPNSAVASPAQQTEAAWAAR